MLDARESGREQVGVAVDVVGRGDGPFLKLDARLPVDCLAQRDDAIIEGEGTVESIHGGERLLNVASQRLRERGLVRGDDLTLDLERLTIAVGRAPGPRGPLDLNAGEPVRLKLGAQ